MKIHSNLPEHEFIDALDDARRAAGVYFERHKMAGSRSHARSIDVLLEGESGRRSNSGKYGAGDFEAATWDQWGIFLAVLYAADPEALCGSAKYPIYADADDFHRKTGERFLADTEETDEPVLSRESADYKITSHRWTYDPLRSRPWSGHATLSCRGHRSVEEGGKNKRRECKAVLVR